MIILEIKTIHANSFKILIESLKECLTDVNFQFEKKEIVDGLQLGGLSIVSLNNSSSILVHLKLNAFNFEYYYCEKDKLNLGINVVYLFKLIKTINNNDILTLFVDDEDINKLGIRIENAERNYLSTYKLNLMDLDSNDFSIPPTEFSSIITMSSHEFHKICKDLNNISDKVEIKNINQKLIFTANGEIASNEIIFGETTNRLKIESNNNNEIIQGIYDLKNLTVFTKCTNLCQSINIYMKNDYPLVIKYSIGTLGFIHLCLSSITNNINQINNSDSDSDSD